MKGIIVTYKPKDAYNRTKLNHSLFGRIVHRVYCGKKKYYYIKGYLHDIAFSKLIDGKIYISNINELESVKKILEPYGEYLFENSERDEKTLILVTGKEYWERIAKEKGFELNGRDTK